MFFPKFFLSLSLLFSGLVLPFSTFAAPIAEMRSNGTIVVGNSTSISVGDSGVINIKRSNGDRYEAFIPLERVSDGKWFSTMHLDDRKVTVDAAKKTTTFHGTFTEVGQPNPIPIEVSLTALDGGKVRVRVRYVTDIPIKQILSSSVMMFQSPHSQHAGHEVTVDGQKIVLSNDAPSPTGLKHIYQGAGLPTVIFFPNDPERRLLITPIQTERFSSTDNNNSPTSAVDTRFFPKDNTIIYELGFSSVDKIASPETYYGVDYLAQDNIRLPRYGASRNLIQNPGFEAGFHGWRFGRWGTITESRSVDTYEIQEKTSQGDGVYAGNRALKINGEKGQNPFHLASFATPMEAGATYTLSFYARANRPGVDLESNSLTRTATMRVHKYFKLTTEWKRYNHTFNAPNEMFQLEFGITNPGEDCTVWIDNVQLEKGEMTEFAAKPVSGTVVADKRGNWVQPMAKINARLELSGTPGIKGSASIKATNFFGKTVGQESKTFTLGADGTASLPLAWAEKLGQGLYLIETSFKVGEFSDRDLTRLNIMPFLDNTAPHKNLFAYGAEDFGNGSWARRLDFYNRAGMGSAIYFNPGPHSYYKELSKNRIETLSSIFHEGHFAIGKHLKHEFHLTADELKRVEEEAYEKAKAWPEIRLWKLVNEPESAWTVSRAETKEFIKPLLAARRGIKRANPNALIFSPDPASLAPQGGTQEFNQFMEEGGGATFDIAAIHAYYRRPEEPDFESDLSTYIKMLDKHGYKGDIWLTEGMGNVPMHLPVFGIDTYGSAGAEYVGWFLGPLSYDLGRGERVAAAYAMRFWLAALKHSGRVKQFVSWHYPQNSHLDYDMTPRSDVFASNTLHHLLGDSRFVADIELGEGMRGYLFEDGSKRPVAVMWTHDINIEKGSLQGASIDISALPANLELLDMTGARPDKTQAITLSPFPVFLRGAAGSTAKLSSALAKLPVNSTTGRPLAPYVTMTNTGQAQLRLQNRFTRPMQGRVQIVQSGNVVFEGNISVKGKETWARPVTISSEAGRLTLQKVQVSFQPTGSAQTWVSDIAIETLSIPRLTTAPAIVGDLTDWPSSSVLPLPRRIITFGSDKPAHTGDADLSGTFYSGWDADHLYLAFNVKDDKFMAGPRVNQAWMGDSIQLYFDSFQNAGAAILPGFDTDDQSFDLWPSAEGLKVQRTVTPDRQLAFLEPGLVANARTSFKRTGDGYLVELAIPKRDLGPINFKSGTSFGFSLIINDKDDEVAGRKRGITLTPEGTEPFSHPELFTVVTLQP